MVRYDHRADNYRSGYASFTTANQRHRKTLSVVEEVELLRDRLAVLVANGKRLRISAHSIGAYLVVA